MKRLQQLLGMQFAEATLTAVEQIVWREDGVNFFSFFSPLDLKNII